MDRTVGLSSSYSSIFSQRKQNDQNVPLLPHAHVTWPGMAAANPARFAHQARLNSNSLPTVDGGASTPRRPMRLAVPVALSSVLRLHPSLVTPDRVNAASRCISSLDAVPARFSGAGIVYLSGNALTSCRGIEQFGAVHTLSLSHNQICSWYEVRSLALLPRLAHLRLEGNPLCKHPLYRVRLVALLENGQGRGGGATAGKLETLDGVAVGAAERLASVRISAWYFASRSQLVESEARIHRIALIVKLAAVHFEMRQRWSAVVDGPLRRPPYVSTAGSAACAPHGAPIRRPAVPAPLHSDLSRVLQYWEEAEPVRQASCEDNGNMEAAEVSRTQLVQDSFVSLIERRVRWYLTVKADDSEGAESGTVPLSHAQVLRGALSGLVAPPTLSLSLSLPPSIASEVSQWLQSCSRLAGIQARTLQELHGLLSAASQRQAEQCVRLAHRDPTCRLESEVEGAAARSFDGRQQATRVAASLLAGLPGRSTSAPAYRGASVGRGRAVHEHGTVSVHVQATSSSAPGQPIRRSSTASSVLGDAVACTRPTPSHTPVAGTVRTMRAAPLGEGSDTVSGWGLARTYDTVRHHVGREGPSGTEPAHGVTPPIHMRKGPRRRSAPPSSPSQMEDVLAKSAAVIEAMRRARLRYGVSPTPAADDAKGPAYDIGGGRGGESSSGSESRGRSGSVGTRTSGGSAAMGRVDGSDEFNLAVSRVLKRILSPAVQVGTGPPHGVSPFTSPQALQLLRAPLLSISSSNNSASSGPASTPAQQTQALPVHSAMQPAAAMAVPVHHVPVAAGIADLIGAPPEPLASALPSSPAQPDQHVPLRGPGLITASALHAAQDTHLESLSHASLLTLVTALAAKVREYAAANDLNVRTATEGLKAEMAKTGEATARAEAAEADVAVLQTRLRAAVAKHAEISLRLETALLPELCRREDGVPQFRPAGALLHCGIGPDGDEDSANEAGVAGFAADITAEAESVVEVARERALALCASRMRWTRLRACWGVWRRAASVERAGAYLAARHRAIVAAGVLRHWKERAAVTVQAQSPRDSGRYSGADVDAPWAAILLGGDAGGTGALDTSTSLPDLSFDRLEGRDTSGHGPVQEDMGRAVELPVDAPAAESVALPARTGVAGVGLGTGIGVGLGMGVRPVGSRRGSGQAQVYQAQAGADQAQAGAGAPGDSNASTVHWVLSLREASPVPPPVPLPPPYTAHVRGRATSVSSLVVPGATAPRSVARRPIDVGIGRVSVHATAPSTGGNGGGSNRVSVAGLASGIVAPVLLLTRRARSASRVRVKARGVTGAPL